MSVGLEADGTIRLAGVCPIEDAEPLLRLVAENRGAAVDWRSCARAHAAVIQILLAVRPKLVGPAANAFLERRIGPLIRR
jgi:hypothetical protein